MILAGISYQRKRIMSRGTDENVSCDSPCGEAPSALESELGNLRRHCCWFFFLGLLLVVCGVAAIVLPAATAVASLTGVVFLGVLLTAAGLATIFASYRAGRWSGLLLHLFVGVLYLVSGLLILDSPGRSALSITLLIAMLFIVMGIFRILGAAIIQFPQWGWSLLNGVVTLLAGMVIYRHFPESAIWVIGLLVGIEMLFCGWTWIMLAAGIKRLARRSRGAS
jgi:uncharacterized membrane protein HdeD (DUF308 family)